MADTIKRKFTVTIEKVIEVEIPESYGSPEMLAEWNHSLWPVESIEDIASYAAEMAAKDFDGYSLDGLGMMRASHSREPRDVSFTVVDESLDVEPAQ